MTWARLLGSILVSAAVVSACSSAPYAASKRSPTASSDCAAAPSNLVHDSLQNVLIGSADPQALIKSFQNRLRLNGARCPTVMLKAATAAHGVPPPPGAEQLHLRWIGAVGEDPQQSQGQALFILRPGNLALRPVLSEAAGVCTGGQLDLSGIAAAVVSSAGTCLQLGAPLRDHVVAESGSATATGDPAVWTLTFRFEGKMVDSVRALSGRQLFVSVDGFAVGRASLSGASLSATGHFDGGATEAHCVVVNVVYPIPVLGGYSVTS
jgi:hypothetical protein